jgi:GNAT superfamily N-acetyltransferase
MALQRIDAAGAELPPPPDRRAWLMAGEALHRQLRPDLPRDYADTLERMFAEGVAMAQLVDGDAVAAIAVWRTYPTTYGGRRFEIDDLVTDGTRRSRGHGRTLLDWLERRALTLGCPGVGLNSSCRRDRAHRFYFRQGYRISGFHFVKDLSPPRSP